MPAALLSVMVIVAFLYVCVNYASTHPSPEGSTRERREVDHTTVRVKKKRKRERNWK